MSWAITKDSRDLRDKPQDFKPGNYDTDRAAMDIAKKDR